MAFCGSCGHELRAGVHFCESCGTAVPGAPPADRTPESDTPEAPEAPEAPGTPAPAGVPGTPAPAGAATPAAAAAPGRRSDRRLLFVLIALVAIAAIIGTVVVLTGGDGDEPAATGEVFLEPLGAATPDPFTKSVVDGDEATVDVALPKLPVRTPSSGSGVQGVATVAGSQIGLYGGTMDQRRCDPEQLIRFLTADDAKAKAWAAVQDIEPEQIPAYIRSLTPIVLTRDTRVTNHGYRNGRATPLQSVLQAGTAVLVDRFGVPRVKCGCGNPLAPALAVGATPEYTGKRWTDFDPSNFVVVVIDRRVQNFVLVDLDGGTPFVRTPGSDGMDRAATIAAVCELFPSIRECDTARTTTTTPARPTTTTTRPPEQTPDKLFEIGNIGGVGSGPTQPSIVSFDSAVTVHWITTYHWNGGRGAPLGTIALRAVDDGTTYGPWNTIGIDGQGGVPNAYWQATVDETFPPGRYEVIDSDPATWAQNAESGGRGFVTVYGWTAGPSVG